MLREVFAAPAELKFVGDPTQGVIEGYGSVFNVMDFKGDMVLPGAFDAMLVEYKAKGTLPFMYGEHSFAMFGGDPLPIGKWQDVQPDEKGLRVKGKLVGMKHPDVARFYDLMSEGVVTGLSIAWKPRDGGIEKGKAAGEPRRYLKSIDVYSIDPVMDPANHLARIESVKAMMQMPNHQAAADAIQAAHKMCLDCMGGGDAPTTDERNQITSNLQSAFKHLTGMEMPKALGFDQLRELKKWLHAPVDQGGRGFSSKQADEIAELVFKSMPRDESGDSAAASAARKEAASQIKAILSGFSLKFGE